MMKKSQIGSFNASPTPSNNTIDFVQRVTIVRVDEVSRSLHRVSGMKKGPSRSNIKFINL